MRVYMKSIIIAIYEFITFNLKFSVHHLLQALPIFNDLFEFLKALQRSF